MQRLSIEEILDRGIENERCLNESEMLVFSVVYLESVADMEGWDHFFTYSMHLHAPLCKVLKLAGDFASLKVIENYKGHLQSLDVPFDAKKIDMFLTKATEQYYSACPDWREEFSNLAEQRWGLITDLFQDKGVQIET